MATMIRDRRSQLLDLAAPLIAERGFHGVSIGDLGAAAGVTGPALYRHFPSKQAILGALLIDISERLLAGGLDCVDRAASPADALQRLVRWHVAFATSRPDLISVQDRDFSSMSKADQRSVRRIQRQYVEVWVEQVVGADQGYRVEQSADEDNARATVHAMFGLLNSTPHSPHQLGRVAADELLSRLALVILATVGA